MSIETQRGELLDLAGNVISTNTGRHTAALKLAQGYIGLAREVDALRKDVEIAKAAPHDPGCDSSHPFCPDCGSPQIDCRCKGYYSGTRMKERDCNCWKAALAAGKVGE